MTCTISEVVQWMELLAPLGLSEDWDNTGLLLGDDQACSGRIMTCLTLTAEVVDEAICERADLVIAHHPLPFRPLKKITTANLTGSLLWRLASARVAVYSPHTAWDSAVGGINDQLAGFLGIHSPQPLVPSASSSAMVGGSGRFGDLTAALSLQQVVEQLELGLADCRPRGVVCGDNVHRVGIACGSGGSLLSAALAQRCDLFLTGEATFHQCLEAQASGISLLMIGHFASERFAMERLAQKISADFPSISCWAAKNEKDPVRNLGLRTSF